MAKRFIPPMPEDVTKYAASINFELDGDYFCNYYKAVDWTIRKSQKIKDWRAMVQLWKKRQLMNRSPTGDSDGRNFKELYRRNKAGN